MNFFQLLLAFKSLKQVNFCLIGLILASFIFPTLASDQSIMEDSEVPIFSKRAEITAFNPSYGKLDTLTEKVLFHFILPYCDERVIQVNRSLFTLVTGYTPNHILDRGIENRPTLAVCDISKIRTIDFKELKDNIDEYFKKIPSYIWFSLLKEVKNLPDQYWDYLKGTHTPILDFYNNNINKIKIDNLVSLFPVTGVTVLKLSANDIKNEGVKSLVPAFKNRKICSLNISHNQISKRGIPSLIRILTNGQIHDLDISYNDLGDEGMKKLAPLFVRAKLTHLNFAHNEVGDGGIESLSCSLRDPNSLLTSLCLYINKITETGIGYLAPTLPGSKIRTLSLSYNPIGNKGVKKLALVLPESDIINLHLSNIGIDDQGIKKLQPSLLKSKIQELHLSKNNIGNWGAGALGCALKDSKNITLLDLSQNEIGDEGAQELGRQLHKNLHLRTLNLSYNDMSEEIKAHLKKLFININFIVEDEKGG